MIFFISMTHELQPMVGLKVHVQPIGTMSIIYPSIAMRAVRLNEQRIEMRRFGQWDCGAKK